MSERKHDDQLVAQSWRKSTLGDICSWLSGGTPSKAIQRFWSGTIPWVSPKDMKVFRIADAIDHISYEALSAGSRLVEVGTVLIVIRGMILAHSFPVAIVVRSVAFNQDIKALTCRAGIEGEYLAYWLMAKSDEILSIVSESTHGTKRFDLADLQQLRFDIPPLPQQRKIARILTTLDNLIEKTEALIAKYQSIKQGMMADLFTRGVDANGKLRPPQSAAPELYKQSELGWIPKEWEVTTLDAAAERVIVGLALSVTQAYRDSGTPLIRNQNIRSGFFEDDEMLFLDPQFAALFPNKRLIEGDVLTVRTGANVGDTALVPAKYCGCLTFTTLITTPKKSVLFAPFMVAYLASSSGLSELNRLLVGGGKENLNVGEFIKLRIPLPDVSEQQACISSMTSVTTTIETERAVVRNLREIKTGLMQDLLTGKVPVKPDESEEEAP